MKQGSALLLNSSHQNISIIQIKVFVIDHSYDNDLRFILICVNLTVTKLLCKYMNTLLTSW